MRVAAFGRRFGWRIGGSPAGIAAFVAWLILLAFAGAIPVDAAVVSTMPDFKVKPGSPMLIEANQLVDDYDKHTVSAVGNVKIYYSGYTLEAERVTYIQPTRRLIAIGSVKLVDPSGIATYAQQIDITDNFSDGFVQSLRVDTPDKTHFAAERAERAGGETTTFINGVYTACEPCKDHPERPPTWQVVAKKIIINHKEKMIYFRGAALQFLGVPIAYIPYFATPDPSVKRKSGLLSPTFGYAAPLGWSLTAPYFLALAPNFDLTVTPTYYTRQGLLGQLEWRHRLSNGYYTVRVAAISQNDSTAFLSGSAGSYAQRTLRGGVRTTGDFSINQYWSFGWDGTLATDRTFTRNYGVLNTDSVTTTSNVHLTGLHDRNYLDIRAMYFQALTDVPGPSIYDQGRQAAVVPVIDYSHVFDDPLLGGEITLTSNLTNVVRSEDDPFCPDGSLPTGNPAVCASGNTYYHGLAGDFLRASAQLDWKRQLIGPLGQVITPFAYLRGDVFGLDSTSAAPTPLTSASSAARFMPAVGLEWSLPVMVTAGGATHVIEPIAQLIVRPDEPLAGVLPNEDAQSLVFDTTNLFEYDKYSGYDRVEGGTRLNAGIRYTGTFANGMSVGAILGQSFQIAGRNSYAQPDIADAGKFSGLETNVSDYVGSISLDTGVGPRLAANGRFDQKTFALQRGELSASGTRGGVTASANYLYLRQDPNAGVVTPQSVVGASASVDVIENLRLFGSVALDLKHTNFSRDSIGVAYDNSCLTVSVAYNESRGTDIPTRTLMFNVVLRTLGEGNVNADMSKLK
jgi:LPS-assembly protein